MIGYALKEDGIKKYAVFNIHCLSSAVLQFILMSARDAHITYIHNFIIKLVKRQTDFLHTERHIIDVLERQKSIPEV